MIVPRTIVTAGKKEIHQTISRLKVRLIIFFCCFFFTRRKSGIWNNMVINIWHGRSEFFKRCSATEDAESKIKKQNKTKQNPDVTLWKSICLQDSPYPRILGNARNKSHPQYPYARESVIFCAQGWNQKWEVVDFIRQTMRYGNLSQSIKRCCKNGNVALNGEGDYFVGDIFAFIYKKLKQ